MSDVFYEEKRKRKMVAEKGSDKWAPPSVSNVIQTPVTLLSATDCSCKTSSFNKLFNPSIKLSNPTFLVLKHPHRPK